MARRDRRGDHIEEDSFARFVRSIVEFASLHRGLITGLGIAVLVGVAGFFAYRLQRQNFDDEALRAFEAAQGGLALRKAAEAYAGSALEARALFHSGRKLIDEKNYDEAYNSFTLFAEKFPENSLTPNVLLLKGMVLVQQDKIDEAAVEYSVLLNRFPESSITPQVLINLAACYERIGNLAEAGRAYGRVKKEFPDSPWSKDAESGLLRINSRKGEAA